MLVKRNKNQKGFTLVELMVTIAVFAIIAAMAVPSFTKMMAQQRLNSTTRELATTLIQARSQAALLRREVTVTLNSSTANTSTNFYWNPTTNNSLTTSSSVTSIVFKSDGTVKDATTDIDFTICNSKSQTTKVLKLTRMGTQYDQAGGTC